MNETRKPRDPLSDLRGAIVAAVQGLHQAGRLSVARGVHSRRFTKRYADGRQKRGGKLWREEQGRMKAKG